MKILAQRPTHISAGATVLLITKTFLHTERQTDRQRQRHRHRQRERERQRERHRERHRERQRYLSLIHI